MDRKERLATLGTLVSAALVASCCLSPVLFLLFGTTIGMLGSLSVLEPYRVYFVMAGFGFWGYGFYRLYVRNPAGRAGVACACERPSRGARALLWVMLGVLVLAIVYPRLAVYYAG